MLEKVGLNRGETATLRSAVVFLDRYRRTIGAEVDRRLGRSQPAPEVRAEIVRRFRSFCRLQSVKAAPALPSLEGLAGNSPAALERTVETAVDVALLCGAPQDVARSLRMLETRFRTGIRRVMRPEEEGQGGRKRRRQTASRKRVRAAIDRIGDAYLALCLESGRVYDLNPAAEALFGAPAPDLLERSFVDLIAPEDRDTYRDLEARLEAGEDATPIRLIAQRLDGTAVEIELSVSNHTIASRRLSIFIARERSPH